MSDHWEGRTLRHIVGEGVWAALLEDAHERLHPARDALLRQGEEGSHVLVLLDGLTKVVRIERDGAKDLLAFRGPGELLGEMAVRGGGGRLASVETLGPCRVAVVHAARFGRFVEEHRLAAHLERHAITRIRETAEQRHGGEAPTRVAGALVRIADVSRWPGPFPGMDVELPLSVMDLAQYLRMSRNTVGRLIAQEPAFRAVRVRGRGGIEIGDLPALRAYAARETPSHRPGVSM
ncbi:Crp/Fnr family transcriptional regulator [Streptomyces sp. 4F14]|uniref:Crp/Fnr family transcriptional regulator n=1 Tax=Streptomyces sp. 4F14 TaxID=3394380 RepID=UPI003A8919B6